MGWTTFRGGGVRLIYCDTIYDAFEYRQKSGKAEKEQCHDMEGLKVIRGGLRSTQRVQPWRDCHSIPMVISTTSSCGMPLPSQEVLTYSYIPSQFLLCTVYDFVAFTAPVIHVVGYLWRSLRRKLASCISNLTKKFPLSRGCST